MTTQPTPLFPSTLPAIDPQPAEPAPTEATPAEPTPAPEKPIRRRGPRRDEAQLAADLEARALALRAKAEAKARAATTAPLRSRLKAAMRALTTPGKGEAPIPYAVAGSIETARLAVERALAAIDDTTGGQP